MKRIWIFSACFVFNLYLFGCGGGGSGATSDDSLVQSTTGSVAMISAAQTEIRKTQPSAIIVWAAGRKKDNSPMSSPQDTEIWPFIALENQGSTPSWDMSFCDDVWTVRDRTEPPFGIEFFDMTQVTMDVDDAWQLVINAGLAEPFQIWELFKDLNPAYPNSQFVFTLPDNRMIFVDTVTGEVN